MSQNKLNQELQQLSGYIYKSNKITKPNDWIEIDSSKNKFDGFYGASFIKGNTVVISFRGTDIDKGANVAIPDFINDAAMGLSFLPVQIIDAQNFYKQTKKDFPNQEIILTGHSLGGSLAQLIGAETGCKTVTFCAYGTANLLDYQIKNMDNITNYGNEKDPVFMSNISNQIGKTLVINENYADKKDTYTSLNYDRNTKMDINKHSIENMGDLSKVSEYKGHNLYNNETLLIKSSIEKNFDLKDIDKRRVITNEEIEKMSNDEFEKNEKFINQQYNAGNIMSKSEADKKVQSGELIWVNSYVRNDGTQVSGYYRRR